MEKCLEFHSQTIVSPKSTETESMLEYSLNDEFGKMFEIVGCADADVLPVNWKGASEKFVHLYYEQGNTGNYKIGNRLACYITYDGKAKIPYKRILIKRKIKRCEF